MTHSKPIALLGAAAVPLAALGLAACGGGGGATAATKPPTTAAATPTTAAATPKTVSSRTVTKVRVANNSKLGKILVDSRGRTLYVFSKDTRTKSACSGACATAWPPLRANGKLSPTGGVKASKLTTIKRSDGKPQVTYNGHPLYGFVKDTKAGQTNGEGITAFGGHWTAISPAGKPVAPKKSGSGSSSAAPKPAPAAPKPAPAPAPPAAPKPAPAGNGIPQNNGGDQDSDNNGGPSDGDGSI